MPILALRSSLLNVGDVILTRSKGWDRHVIAWFSGGTFSHAALFIGGTLTYESDGEDVIGLRRLVSIGWERAGNGPDLLLRLPEGTIDARVLRHPQIAGIPPEQVSTAFKDELFESAGQDYSRLCRLVDIAQTRFVSLRAAISFIVQHGEEFFSSADNVSGPFCSELVARFYGRLNLALFDKEKSPADTSPNDFTASTLKVESGIVVDVENGHINEWPPIAAKNSPSSFEAILDESSDIDPSTWSPLAPSSSHPIKELRHGLQHFGYLG